eukprot:TRINITY_DN9327_c0_g1_i1.p1 TRINITY_DN9327_c0_g1~~TRINITY_DN9327_c0_g1_i1.p1  ORF type:complete len:329 (-),score=37.63 TRINITY_DN9327_c0_g1_i1:63-1049(-)
MCIRDRSTWGKNKFNYQFFQKDFKQQKDMADKIIFIKDRKGKRIMEVTLENDMTVTQLKQKIAQKTKIPEISQRLIFSNQILDYETKTLESYKVQNNSEIECRNLGKQIEWKTVFYVEYGGPIIISSLLYFLASKMTALVFVQKLGYFLFMIHYLKREIETNSVHVFSKQSMPIFNLFKNCFHYWIIAGFSICFELFFWWDNPNYSEFLPYLIAGLFLFCEFMNLNCHINLSNIRRVPGTMNTTSEELAKKRQIPYGYGFGRISCANYFWEICAWACFAALVRCWTAYFFLAVSTIQMTIWALDKQKRYKKEFPDYPKQRKAIIPFLL